MGGANSTKRSQNEIQAFLEKEKEKFLDKFENPIRQNAQLDDFELIRTIGTGSFGNDVCTNHLLRKHFFLRSRSSPSRHTSIQYEQRKIRSENSRQTSGGEDETDRSYSCGKTHSPSDLLSIYCQIIVYIQR